MSLLLGPRSVYKEHQGCWRWHPDSDQASQWADRYQGVWHWPGCTCPVGPGCWQTNAAEWTAPPSKFRGCHWHNLNVIPLKQIIVIIHTVFKLHRNGKAAICDNSFYHVFTENFSSIWAPLVVIIFCAGRGTCWTRSLAWDLWKWNPFLINILIFFVTTSWSHCLFVFCMHAVITLVIYTKLFLCQVLAMARAVSSWHVTMEAQVQSQANPHGICGGLSGNGTDFSQSTFVFPCQYYSFVALISFIHFAVLCNLNSGQCH